MDTPPTIKEDGTRWTLENARPLAMRVVIGAAAPVALAGVGFIMWGDALEHRWVMLVVRALFALLILVAARFALFGSERLAVDGGEVVWTRGSAEQRCKVGEVEKLERAGTQLHVHVAGLKHPIVVGAGLRQPPAAMAWLTERVHRAILAAKAARTK